MLYTLGLDSEFALESCECALESCDEHLEIGDDLGYDMVGESDTLQSTCEFRNCGVLGERRAFCAPAVLKASEGSLSVCPP